MFVSNSAIPMIENVIGKFAAAAFVFPERMCSVADMDKA